MSQWHRVIVIVLVFCIGILPVSDVAVLAATRPDTAFVKQQVAQYGVGAKVKVRLAEGKKLRGSIAGIEDEAFLLASGRAAVPKRLSYDQVSGLKLATLTYKAAGQPNPAEARRVVLGLGVGKHIMVKTADGKEYHGLIVAIEEGGFAVMPDQQATPVQIAYNDVLQVGPNLSTFAKVAIVVAVAVAIFVAWAVHDLSQQ
jgi:ribosome maturation factor RimP